MANHQRIRFSLNLTADQYLSVYQGVAKKISVLADDGRRLEFPASNIQRYLTRDGIAGHFEMEITSANKFIGIYKLS